MAARSYQYAKQIKRSYHADEYYTPQNAVDMIVPYIQQTDYKKIWCPFDFDNSNYVQTFIRLGYEVEYAHIETGQDFFSYTEPRGDIVVSNPPFSRRTDVFHHLFTMEVPFAIVMNFNGLFDAKERNDLFRRYGVEMLVPYGRMRFIHRDLGQMNSPSFQSVYICHNVLPQQIVFSDCEFHRM